MNFPERSPSRMGSTNRVPACTSKNSKVSDSNKVAKLRVTSREEIKVRKTNEELRKRDPSSTSDAKSYLKSRRDKARNERRTDILDVLDHNLEKFTPTTQDSAKDSRPSSRSPTRDSRSKIQNRVVPNFDRMGSSRSTISTTRNRTGNGEDRLNSSTSSSSLKQPNRLRVLNPFRNRSRDAEVEQDKPKRNESRDSGKGDRLKRTSSDRRTIRRQKEQKEAIHIAKQDSKRDVEAEMQEILEDVLRKYPKEKCRTFADHMEFAFAELSTQSYQRKDLQITTEKLLDLKSKLHSHLASTVGGGSSDVSVEAATMQGQPSRQQTNQQHLQRNHSDRSSGQLSYQSQQNQERDLQSILSTSKKRPSQQRLIHQSTLGTSSPKQVSSVSPKTKSPTSPGSDEWNTTNSPQNRSSSSKSLPLPKPKSASLDDHLPQKKSSLEDSTSLTELDDESTLVPVVRLLIVDPAGHLGKYTGTICVNTGKPHGSGKLEYEDGGSYHGDWNQGNWSGYGRHAKPNGDIYEGTFFDNNKHGMGTYRYRDGKRVFEGRYVMGQRVDGQMTYGDGSVYKGQWYDGKRNGRGTYRFKDSSVYKGEFLQDVIHGVGQLVWPDGAKYVGEWNQGHRHGIGKEFASDGRLRYEGKWKQSVPAS